MRKAALILLPAAAIILELLPCGAALKFAVSPDTVKIKTFSYFSLIPFGYSSFAPFITAVLSCGLLALAVFTVVTKNEKSQRALAAASILSAVASAAPLLFGAEHYTATGFLITALLTAETILAVFCRHSTKTK